MGLCDLVIFNLGKNIISVKFSLKIKLDLLSDLNKQ